MWKKKQIEQTKILFFFGRIIFFVVFCSYGRAGLHRSDNGGSGAFPGEAQGGSGRLEEEAQGGWRRWDRGAAQGGREAQEGGGSGGRQPPQKCQ